MKNQAMFVFGMLLVINTAAPVFAQDYNRGAKQTLEDDADQTPRRSKISAQNDAAVVTIDATKVQVKQVQAANQAPVNQQQQQTTPIYILQQPTTNVDATPVKESRADQLRKQREEVEHQNDNRLIEKLEDDRLNSEKERVDKILTPLATTAAPVVVQPQAAPVAGVVAQPQAVATAVVVVPQKEEPKLDREIISESGLSKAAKLDILQEKKEESNKFSIGSIVGVGNYSSANNVNGAFALGGIGDLTLPNGLIIEGTITYSSYDILNQSYCYYCGGSTSMNQWDFTAGANYRFLKGTVSPIAGGYLGYTRRDYTSKGNNYGYGYGSNYGNNLFSGSNAFNGGLVFGVDVKASEAITIGADFRYTMNISYHTDNPYAYGYGYGMNYATPIESLSYYIIGLTAKIAL